MSQEFEVSPDEIARMPQAEFDALMAGCLSRQIKLVHVKESLDPQELGVDPYRITADDLTNCSKRQFAQALADLSSGRAIYEEER